MNKTEQFETLPEGYEYTEFYKLTNNIIPEGKYSATDKGIYYFKGKTEIRLCTAIALTGINYDALNEEQYIDIEFYNRNLKEVSSLSISMGELGTPELKTELRKQGIVGDITNYVISLLETIEELEEEGIDPLDRTAGAARLGFELSNDFEYNYDNFVGIDTRTIKLAEYKVLDKLLFKKKGDLDSYKKMLSHLFECNTEHNNSMFRQALAISLFGVMKEILGERLPLANYAFVGGSGIGKSFIATLVQGVWGSTHKTGGIRVAAASSYAGLRAKKKYLNCVPAIIDDVQELVKKNGGIKQLEQLIYEHVNAENVEKATQTGKSRSDNYSWDSCQILFGENDNFSTINMDGSGNRLWIVNTNLTKGDKIFQDDFSEHDDVNTNYGIIAPLFIEKIKEYVKTNNIKSEFSNLVKYYSEIITDDKKAKIAAIIQYTFNLLIKFDLLPEGTAEMTRAEVLQDYDTDEVTDSEVLLYNTFVERVFRNRILYPDKNDKFTQTDYDEAKAKGQEIRGRIFIEGDKYKLFIPAEFFIKNVTEIITSMNITGVSANIKSWKNRGWAEFNTQGKSKWSCSGITYQYDKKDTIRCKKENCYKIVLGDCELRAAQKDEWLEKGYSEKDIDWIQSKNAELEEIKRKREQNDYTENDFMSIPANI